MSFRNRWSSSTSSRIASKSWSRCHRHSSRPALSPSPFRRGGTCGLDRIGGRTELVRRNVRDDRRLASGVCGMAWRPLRSLAAAIAWPPAERVSVMVISPRAQARPSSIARRGRRSSGPSRLEEIQDVFRARCRPQGEEVVIRISEGPTAADRHETRVAFLSGGSTQHLSCSHLPNVYHDVAAPSGANFVISRTQ